MKRTRINRALIWVFFLISFVPQIAAQNDFEEFLSKRQAEYSRFSKSLDDDFEEFRRKRNQEFAEFLSKRWEQFDVEKPVVQDKPEPPVPVYVPVDEVPEDKPLVEVPVDDVVDNEIPEQNKPIDFPVDIPKEEDKPQVVKTPMYSFSFYGEKPELEYDGNKMRLRLKGVDEKNVGEAWSFLSSRDYDMVIHGCLSYVDKYKLDDWGLFKLVRTFADSSHGSGTSEAAVVAAYMMCQLGYDARIYRAGSQLGVMIPVGPDVAEYSYLTIGGRNYYTFGPSSSAGVYTYDNAFDGATKALNLYRKEAPVIGRDIVSTRAFASKKYPEISCTTLINKNLMAFYDDVPPVLDYTYYVLQPCDSKTMEGVYAALGSSISGKDEVAAVNMILDFVQQGFEYETDGDQFGHEKYNFPEETFYYKACDCDDRAILFSVLVRKLTGLDVVLIDYPNHLATAVRFNGKMSGDYVVVGGQKYFICDPTYIGASAGMAMPSVDSSKLRVFPIKR